MSNRVHKIQSNTIRQYASCGYFESFVMSGIFAWSVERPLSCQVHRFTVLLALALRLLLPPPSFLTFNRASPPLPSTCCMPVHPHEIERSLFPKFRILIES